MDKFSPNGTARRSTGTDASDKIPINLSDNIRNKLNVGKKYQSGRISMGVAKAFARATRFKGSRTARPNTEDTTPKITTGNMYNISFGHAGSP